MEKIKEKILALIKDFKEDIPEDTSVNLLERGQIDSFDVVNIISCFETNFAIEIEAGDILPANFGSIDSMATLLTDKYKVSADKL